MTPQVMYHVAPRAARESILQFGLDASIHFGDSAQLKNTDDVSWAPRGNYLSEKIEQDYMTPDSDLWQVDVSGLKLTPDKAWYKGWYTTDPIPPDRLQLQTPINATGASLTPSEHLGEVNPHLIEWNPEMGEEAPSWDYRPWAVDMSNPESPNAVWLGETGEYHPNLPPEYGKGLVFEHVSPPHFHPYRMPQDEAALPYVQRYYHKMFTEAPEMKRDSAYSPFDEWSKGEKYEPTGDLDAFKEDAAQEIENGEALARDIIRTLPEEDWPKWVHKYVGDQVWGKPEPIKLPNPPSPMDRLNDPRNDTTFPPEWTSSFANDFVDELSFGSEHDERPVVLLKDGSIQTGNVNEMHSELLPRLGLTVDDTDRMGYAMPDGKIYWYDWTKGHEAAILIDDGQDSHNQDSSSSQEAPETARFAQDQVNYAWPDWDTIDTISRMAVDNHQGYRDPGLIQGAVGNTQMAQSYGAHADIFETAAHLLAKIQRQQAVVEGNKRTATMTAMHFLEENGYDTTQLADDAVWPQLEQQIMLVSESPTDEPIEALANIFRQHCVPMRTAKMAMAERSGDPQLDALIEEYFSVLHSQMKTEELRDPQWAAGACVHESEQFAQFLQQHGIDAQISGDRMVDGELTEDYLHPDDFGYQDRTNPGLENHVAVIAWVNGSEYMIDFTASQYGYTEFPMVQKLDNGGWQREWTSKTSAEAWDHEPGVWYHVTGKEYLSQIMEQGLTPRTEGRTKHFEHDYADGVFLFGNQEEAFNWYRPTDDGLYDPVVLKITGIDETQVQTDPEVYAGEEYFEHPYTDEERQAMVHDQVIYPSTISPGQIEIEQNEQWMPLSSYDPDAQPAPQSTYTGFDVSQEGQINPYTGVPFTPEEIQTYKEMAQRLGDQWTSKTAAWGKELWQPGERAFFEYHCNQAHDSADAQLWYRSHQPVTIISLESDPADYQGWEPAEGEDIDPELLANPTQEMRGEAGMPYAYKVRFDDGTEGTAMEDELLTSSRYKSKGFDAGEWGPPSDWQQRLGPYKQSKTAMGLRGDLPPLTFSQEEVQHYPDGSPGLVARLNPEGSMVGFISYYPESNTIRYVWVSPSFQRMGIATAMMNEYERITGQPLQHSEDLTQEGEAWKQSLGKTAMGLRGDLPKNIKFDVKIPNDYNTPSVCRALMSSGNNVWTQVGKIVVDADGMIEDVEVLPAFQRMGIATAMLDALREQGLEVQHNWGAQSPAGEGWAQAEDPEGAEEYYDRTGSHRTADTSLDASNDNWWGPQSVNLKQDANIPGQPGGMGNPHDEWELDNADTDGRPFIWTGQKLEVGEPYGEHGDIEARLGDRAQPHWVYGRIYPYSQTNPITVYKGGIPTPEWDRAQAAAEQWLQKDRQYRKQANINEQWVYLNGKVQFGGHYWDIMHRLASEAGLDPSQITYLSNMMARNSLPPEYDVAMGTIRNGYPQIWLSTIDRNHVWDEVMRNLQVAHTSGILNDRQDKFYTSHEDHLASLDEYGPLLTHGRLSRIDPDFLTKYIQKRGPYLYHYTHEEAIPSILKHGLLPRYSGKRLPGRSVTWSGPWSSRPKHVYLTSQRRNHPYHNRVPVRIDLRKIDPEMIDSNEDNVGAVGFRVPTLPGYEQVKTKNGYIEPHNYLTPGEATFGPEKIPSPWRTWGGWADAHSHIIDQPEWVAHSLTLKQNEIVPPSVAIRGGVPADAIDLPEKTSNQKVARFVTSMPPAARVPDFAKEFERTPRPLDWSAAPEVRGYDWVVDQDAIDRLKNMQRWRAPNFSLKTLNSKGDRYDKAYWNNALGYHNLIKYKKDGQKRIRHDIAIHPLSDIVEANNTLWHEIQHAYQHDEDRADIDKYKHPKGPYGGDEYREQPMETDANDFADYMSQHPLLKPAPPYMHPDWVPDELYNDAGDWDPQSETYQLSPWDLQMHGSAMVNQFRHNYDAWRSMWQTPDEYEKQYYDRVSKVAAEQPKVVEVPTEAYELEDDEWLDRRPFIYDRADNTVLLGAPGTHHYNIEDAIGIWVKQDDNGNSADPNLAKGCILGDSWVNEPNKCVMFYPDNDLEPFLQPVLQPYIDQLRQGSPEPMTGDDWTLAKVAHEYPLEVHEVPADNWTQIDDHDPFWMDRRPFVYDSRANEILLGDPGTHHDPLYKVLDRTGAPKHHQHAGCIVGNSWTTKPSSIMDDDWKRGITMWGNDKHLGTIAPALQPYIDQLRQNSPPPPAENDWTLSKTAGDWDVVSDPVDTRNFKWLEEPGIGLHVWPVARGEGISYDGLPSHNDKMAQLTGQFRMPEQGAGGFSLLPDGTIRNNYHYTPIPFDPAQWVREHGQESEDYHDRDHSFNWPSQYEPWLSANYSKRKLAALI